MPAFRPLAAAFLLAALLLLEPPTALAHHGWNAYAEKPMTVEAVIDTGFTEFLALRAATVRRLRLPYRGSQHATLANGQETELAVYRGIVEWHGDARPVSVFAVEGGALLGMAMLEGSRLTIDVQEDGPVQIQPLAAP